MKSLTNYVKSQNKALSCGFIIINNDKLLACHATGRPYKNGWDISKGHIEDGETPLECACRELKEETGIDSSRLTNIRDLGKWAYTKYKDLYLFVANYDVDLSKCKCTSYFEQHGRQIPEMDAFKLIDFDKIDDAYYRSMAEVIKKALNIKNI